MNTFLAKSHPENAEEAVLLPARAKAFNADLRDRLKSYAEEHNLSNAALARELATNPTAVSKYLNGKPEGDVEGLESVIEDILKANVRRAALGVELFETSVTRQVCNFIETIRRINRCGLVYGEAGIGKTCAAAIHSMGNPSTITADLRAWNATREGVQSLLFHSIENRTWNGHQKRVDFMVERLRGSKRLILLDNAHKLTRGARDWLIDFHDETKCPMVFLGRKGMHEQLERDPDQFSFFGLVSEVKFRGDEAAAANQLLQQRMPAEAAQELEPFAATVAAHPGHLRALASQVDLAIDLQSSPSFRGQPALSFKSAHTKLPRNYSL
jgi:DNA transposition AAA+ family ATPase